tara:strand:+ start:106 stop:723 length:618 start_codon:yes stop_codon:yes gene_type:complete
MLFRTPPEVLLLLVPVLIFALCFHEFAHAWVAYKLGDPTAKQSGRLTLNPLAHLDPMGSLMILIIGFGYAKPVPVDARYLKNPRTDMMKVAFAGPAANLLLAFVGGTIIRAHIVGGSLILMLYLFTQINIMLAIFNMIPIPPLDGSQIFSGLMVRKNPNLVMKLQMYGPQILFGLILIGYLTEISPLWWAMSPFVNFFLFLFAGI